MKYLNEAILMLALAGFGLLFYMRKATITEPVLQEPSLEVPWYLVSNTMPAIPYSSNYALAQTSVGMQNTGAGEPCALCSMFGTTYGSQY